MKTTYIYIYIDFLLFIILKWIAHIFNDKKAMQLCVSLGVYIHILITHSMPLGCYGLM